MELLDPKVLEKLEQILMPHLAEGKERLKSNGNKFVHYTTAENALNIIKSKVLWMRSPTCMNDYMEISHGHGLLVKYFQNKEKRQSFISSIDKYENGLGETILNEFDKWWGQIRHDTFIASISEYSPDEKKHGRLSMWRAYGDQEGKAALILNNPEEPSPNLGVILSPAAYYTPDELENDLDFISSSISENIDSLKSLQRESVSGTIITSLIIYALCLKHPGFKEEKEWRLIFLPNMLPNNSWVKRAVESIGGIPQVIYKMPLENSEELNITGLNLAEVLDYVLIGPTEYPLVQFDAFLETLKKESIPEAHNKVVISDIPLRIRN